MSRDDDFLLHVARGAFSQRVKPERLGVAVSGGSDSMALLHLLHAADFAVEAVTVDHGLRPEAVEEARFVAATSTRIGAPHEVLRWDGPAPAGNLQDQARRARYALIADWARRRGLGHVALGHTADDQAETFLMRLARGAGIDGLSGMRHSWTESGVSFVRPFLLQTRAALRGYLERHGIAWVEDPSNSDERYERVKARKVLARLKPLGITTEVLSGVVGNLWSVRVSIEALTADIAREIARYSAGDVIFARRTFLIQPPDVRRRLLIAALRLVSGAEYPPREHSLVGLETAICARRDRTLAGCRVLSGDPDFRFTREARAVRALECPTTDLWDGRWRLDGPHAPGLTVRALGPEGLKGCPDWRDTGIPRATLAVSPAVWAGDRLVAAPLAGNPGEWTAELAKDRNSLSSFVVSH